MLRTMNSNLTTVDLFSGAGGITEGFRQAGFTCIFANDISPDATATLSINHRIGDVSTGPIESVDPGRVRRSMGMARGELDCLVGGPPCQGFSINAPLRFLEDPRNELFAHFAEFLTEFHPKTFMFENVPGLLSFGRGIFAKQVTEVFSEAGYKTTMKVLLAANYGVPQERWRLIILGTRLPGELRHPLPTHHAIARANFTGGATLTLRTTPDQKLKTFVTVEDAISDLPVIRSGDGMPISEYRISPESDYQSEIRIGSNQVFNHIAPKLSEINLRRLKYIQPGGSWRDIPFGLLPAGMKRARRSDHTRRYGRLTKNGLAGTVMTKMDPHWGSAFHYEQDRSFSVREAARFQSFPDNYRFFGSRGSQYEQIGNAVPVLLARAIAQNIREHIWSNPRAFVSDHEVHVGTVTG